MKIPIKRTLKQKLYYCVPCQLEADGKIVSTPKIIEHKEKGGFTLSIPVCDEHSGITKKDICEIVEKIMFQNESRGQMTIADSIGNEIIKSAKKLRDGMAKGLKKGESVTISSGDMSSTIEGAE